MNYAINLKTLLTDLEKKELIEALYTSEITTRTLFSDVAYKKTVRNPFKSWYNKRLNSKEELDDLEQPDYAYNQKETFEQKQLNHIAERISNTSSHSKLFEVAQSVAHELGSETWELLEDLSRKFITTGELISITFLALNEDILLDFSPSILSYCKALETELNEKLITNFKLRVLDKSEFYNQQLKQMQIRKDGRIHYNSNLAYIIDNYNQPNALKQTLTLGEHNFIINKLVTNQRLNIFEELYKNLFLTGTTDMKELYSTLKQVANKYRNPSAHSEELSLYQFQQCREIVIGKKGALHLFHQAIFNKSN